MARMTTVGSRRGWMLGAFAACAMLVLLVVYALSYAPHLSRKYHGVHIVDLSSGTASGFHRPVEWMIDHTPLRDPLLFWADFWGVRDVMESFSDSRRGTMSGLRLRSRGG